MPATHVHVVQTLAERRLLRNHALAVLATNGIALKALQVDVEMTQTDGWMCVGWHKAQVFCIGKPCRSESALKALYSGMTAVITAHGFVTCLRTTDMSLNDASKPHS